jgi:perosamine synthetase
MKLLRVFKPFLGKEEIFYLKKCINTNWISSEGPFVKQFEKKTAKLLNRKYGIAVSNGTAALQIAFQSLNLKKDDEVILPSFSIVSCILAVIRSGAKPVLADCDLNTFNIYAEEIEKKITSKTKAILVVHTYGLPVDMNPIIKIVKKRNLFLIEDAAEQLGQKYYNKKCGSFGHLSILSFYANKNLTTGEGGMILTNSEALNNKCLELRNLSFGKKRFIHHSQGWNYRITNLQAAVGLAQLKKLSKIIKIKRKIGTLYNKKLKECSFLKIPLTKTKYANNIYWVYSIILNKKINKDDFKKYLLKNNIEVRDFFYPMHLQPVFKRMYFYKKKDLTNSEYLSKHGIYLPSGPNILEKDITYITKIIKNYDIYKK